MRLLFQDPVTGLRRVRLETPSDLWRIARLVRPGDLVGASTTRRDPEAPLDVAGAERARRRVFLTVRVTQVEFHGFSKHVRLTGPIVEGPFDIGRHHTLDLTEGDDVTLARGTLSSGERAILEEGLAGKGDPTIVIAAVDWGDSSIVRVRGRAIEPIADLRRTIAGKRYAGGQGEKDRATYLAELEAVLVREAQDAQALLVVGPGFLKEELAKRIQEHAPALARRLRVYPTAESGRVGVDELLKSGRASEVLRGTVAAEEAEVVERLVRALAGGKRAAVGLDEGPGGRGRRRDGDDPRLRGPIARRRGDPDPRPVPRGADPDLRRAVGRRSGCAARGPGGIGAILRYDWTSAERPRGSPAATRADRRSAA